MKTALVFSLVILMTIGLVMVVTAAEKSADKKQLEQIEVSGVLEVTPADAAKNQKYPTVLLIAGEKKYKLLPGRDKIAFAELEKMTGKTVNVKGDLLPANDKYPLPAIKVNEVPGVSKPNSEGLRGKPVGKGQAREKK